MKVLHPQNLGEITPKNEGSVGSHSTYVRPGMIRTKCYLVRGAGLRRLRRTSRAFHVSLAEGKVPVDGKNHAKGGVVENCVVKEGIPY